MSRSSALSLAARINANRGIWVKLPTYELDAILASLRPQARSAVYDVFHGLGSWRQDTSLGVEALSDLLGIKPKHIREAIAAGGLVLTDHGTVARPDFPSIRTQDRLQPVSEAKPAKAKAKTSTERSRKHRAKKKAAAASAVHATEIVASATESVAGATESVASTPISSMKSCTSDVQRFSEEVKKENILQPPTPVSESVAIPTTAVVVSSACAFEEDIQAVQEATIEATPEAIPQAIPQAIQATIEAIPQAVQEAAPEAIQAAQKAEVQVMPKGTTQTATVAPTMGTASPLAEAGLIFPACISEAKRAAARATLRNLPMETAQAILDELAGASQTAKGVANPGGWLFSLAEKARRGEFTPNLGIAIAEQRLGVVPHRFYRPDPTPARSIEAEIAACEAEIARLSGIPQKSFAQASVMRGLENKLRMLREG